MSYALGSHLVASRLGYTHHGIYIGRGLVVHYLLDEGITIATLEDFADGQTVQVRPHPGASYSGEECVCRALSRVGEDDYNLIFNNCEHFATWCATGEARSGQVEDAVLTGLGAAAVTGVARSAGTSVVKALATGAIAGGTAGAATAGIVGTTVGASAVVGVASVGAASLAAAPVAVTVGVVTGIVGIVGSLLDDWFD